MAEAITLRNIFNPDQLITYRSRTEIRNKAQDTGKGSEIGTRNAAWEVDIIQRVLALEGADKAHILYHSVPVSIPVEAQMMGVLNKKQVIYVLMDTKGKVLEASGLGFQGIVNFPSDLLKEGDHWVETNDVDLPGLPQPARHSRTFTLKGFEKVQDRECAIITVTSEETHLELEAPDKSGKIQYRIKTSGEFLFAYKEGYLVKSVVDTHFTSGFGDTMVEGNNRFSQELIEVKAQVPV
ncbi:MAG: hypothetical protein AB2L14_27065 [Candidatus Xenobiia bacterium LiM19]